MSPPASPHLRPGDFVRVREPEKILATLDADGTRDGLVFMPEMLPFVGRRFRVLRRLEKTCVEGSPSGMNEFHHNDVVFLENLRCPGEDHDGCGRSCMIFWKEAWLAKLDPDDSAPAAKPDAVSLASLAARLRPAVVEGKYFCQSTQLLKATAPLSGIGRLKKCIADIRSGTYKVPQAIMLVIRPLFAKVMLRFRHRIPPTNRIKTPKASLGLNPGDLVEIKSAAEIAETLDIHGRNRGLGWSNDLAHYCGRRFRVAQRMNRMIIEFNGTMVNVTDTVLLNGATCPCKYAIGGCPRLDLIYWREIWLRKIEEPAKRGAEPASAAAHKASPPL